MSSIFRALFVRYWIGEVGIAQTWTATCLANGDHMQLKPSSPHYAKSVAASLVFGELPRIVRSTYIIVQGHECCNEAQPKASTPLVKQ